MTDLKSIAAGLYLAVATIALSAGSAQATLLSIDDSTGVFGSTGSGAVTFDDVNKLEWLDLTFSTNRTFADTALEFGAGGLYKGWRHATELEIIALFTEGGFPPPQNSTPATQVMISLIDQLGRTFTSGPVAPTLPTGADFNHIAAGFHGPLVVGGVSATRIFQIPTGIDNATTSVNDTGSPTARTGNWLVRAPIPEPTALILFGSGVVLLGAMRRRKRAN